MCEDRLFSIVPVVVRFLQFDNRLTGSYFQLRGLAKMHRLHRGVGESSGIDGVVKEEMWADDTRQAENERQGESAMSVAQVGTNSCTMDGCRREPTHGVAGKKAEFCAWHGFAGSVNVTKECNMDDCFTRANYGLAGSKKREFCATHALEGMVNFRRTTCTREGCRNGARCGLRGEKKLFCKRHALQGMVSSEAWICKHDGCGKRSIYGVAGI